MDFLGRGFDSHHPQQYIFQIFPMSNLEDTLPGTQENGTTWIKDRSVRISGRPALPLNGGESVIRLSLGKLLVNLLQVVKRTNTPTNTLTVWRDK